MPPVPSVESTTLPHERQKETFMHYPPEPFRIKVTEPIRPNSREEHEAKLDT